MCGIAILLEPTAPAWLPDVLRAMTRIVRHRGPDGEGFSFHSPAANGMVPVISGDTPPGVAGELSAPPGCTLGLGHRRLAILDLTAAGHQPMSDAARDCWVCFNGEIYNYVELRSELVQLGHVFRSHTDTEIILAAWRQWGASCLARFNGMFAFVLFDGRDRRLFAARDRFGVKPLYFWRTPTGGFAVASEIKQFTAHPAWRARVNGQRAYDFLNWGISDHTAETLFADVFQLRGGEYLSAPLAECAGAMPQRWYELKPEEFAGDFPAAAERFRSLLDDSVRLRLRADVPIGSCLSGGLDSSSIVGTVRSQLGPRAIGLQNVFSAYSDVPRFDERSFIEDVARSTGAAAHHVVPDADSLLRELDQLVWHQDEPFGSTSIYAQWCVFALARKHGVPVMLDGQGADEALGGYHGYFGPRLAGLLRQGRWGTFQREAAAVRSLHAQTLSMQLRMLANELLPPSCVERLRRLAGRTVRSPAFLDLVKLGAEPLGPHDGSVDLRDPVRSLGHAQLTALSLPMLLRFEDRDSMAHSVEARLPFLDYRLVEFCLGLPEDFKLSAGWTKRVLREGMRGRLPETVRLRRDKLGFATAEEVWMRERHRPEFLQLVDDAIALSGGILTAAARRKAERMLAGVEPFSFLVWRFISFGAWIRRFNLGMPGGAA
ncbi:MAG: asparagine synthase (glutamine-hydrolyzing) [Opitutaceae bacterium]|nr:asparagine synthase (glutamine-hydrolyzing) [Opitutaceae bacterium]